MASIAFDCFSSTRAAWLWCDSFITFREFLLADLERVCACGLWHSDADTALQAAMTTATSLLETIYRCSIVIWMQDRWALPWSNLSLSTFQRQAGAPDFSFEFPRIVYRVILIASFETKVRHALSVSNHDWALVCKFAATHLWPPPIRTRAPGR